MISKLYMYVCVCVSVMHELTEYTERASTPESIHRKVVQLGGGATNASVGEIIIKTRAAIAHTIVLVDMIERRYIYIYIASFELSCELQVEICFPKL